jgi:beta-mannosidase
MNVLRNWGGGIYQSEAFYDFCDKNGILVWEEFMFACAMYPRLFRIRSFGHILLILRDEEFLDNVKREVEYQTIRLSHHASILLWSSNNENEGALNWYPETRANRDLYLVDQVRRFDHICSSLIFRLLYTLTLSVPLFWTSILLGRFFSVHLPMALWLKIHMFCVGVMCRMKGLTLW